MNEGDEVISDQEKKALRRALSRGRVVVCFTKANGETRQIVATTSSSDLVAQNALPQPDQPDRSVSLAEKLGNATFKPVRKASPEVQRMWDVEAKAWRSFRWDRLQWWAELPSEDAASQQWLMWPSEALLAQTRVGSSGK